MTTKQRLAVLGGDARQIAMVHALSTFGYEVFCWGLGECNEAVGSAMVGKCWDEVVAQSDAIVLPLPFSSDGVRLNCPLEADAPGPRITAILDAICLVIERTPPELLGDILHNGIVMTGGGSLLYGFDKLVTRVTKIPTRVAKDAVSCVAIGTGKSLDNLDMLSEGAINLSRERKVRL